MANEVRMKALKSFNHPATNQHIRRGSEFSVIDSTGRELETLGHAVKVAKMAAGHPNKMETSPLNKAAQDGPLGFRGGAIGEGRSASLSPVARVQAPQTSKPRGRPRKSEQ